MPLSQIQELEEFSYYRELADEYANRNGSPPFGISHWDPSEQTMDALLKHLRLPPPPLAAPYIYSYYLDVKPQVLQRLGCSTPTRTCLLVQAGTNAMLLATWWLRARGVTRNLILCPVYFPVFYTSELMQINYLRLYMQRKSGQWQLPREDIMAAIQDDPAHSAVWLTNPVYCTGTGLSISDIEFLRTLLNNGVAVIADECLSIADAELCRSIGPSDGFIAIYSPHKSICLNAIKFAAIVFDNKYQEFFDRWADVLVGGLSAANHTAILHFINDNFTHYKSEFLRYINHVLEKVITIVNSYGSLLETDNNAIGHYITCYAPHIHGSKGNDRKFLWQLVSHSGTMIIPGVRNHFSTELGFNFRINLARGCPQFFSSLRRITKYLAEISSCPS